MPAPSSTSRAAHTSRTESACGLATETPRLGSRVASPSATRTVSASRTVGRETPSEAAIATSRSGVPDSSSPSKTARRSSSATRSTVEACSRRRVPNGPSSCRASCRTSVMASLLFLGLPGLAPYVTLVNVRLSDNLAVVSRRGHVAGLGPSLRHGRAEPLPDRVRHQPLHGSERAARPRPGDGPVAHPRRDHRAARRHRRRDPAAAGSARHGLRDEPRPRRGAAPR